MKTIIFDISPPITYLAEFCFSKYGQKCCWPIELQDSLKCNISRQKWMIKFIFGMQRKIEILYKLILKFWMFVSRHAQSSQNKKFAYLCNISTKNIRLKVEVFFLPADKYESFLQGDTILDVYNQAYPKYPKQQVCNIFAISKGNWEE